jgi:hypothetical protein
MSQSTTNKSISSPRKSSERLKATSALAKEQPKLISLSKLKELMQKSPPIGEHKLGLDDRVVCNEFIGRGLKKSLSFVSDNIPTGTNPGKNKNYLK